MHTLSLVRNSAQKCAEKSHLIVNVCNLVYKYLNILDMEKLATYFSPNILISQSSNFSSGTHRSVTLGSVTLGESARFLSLKPLL